MYIYVAGPSSTGDSAANVREAVPIGHLLMDLGHTVCVPHLSHFMNLFRSRSTSEWLRQRLSQLEHCDAVFKLPGGLPDCYEELKLASETGKTVYRVLQEVPNRATDGGKI